MGDICLDKALKKINNVMQNNKNYELKTFGYKSGELTGCECSNIVNCNRNCHKYCVCSTYSWYYLKINNIRTDVQRITFYHNVIPCDISNIYSIKISSEYDITKIKYINLYNNVDNPVSRIPFSIVLLSSLIKKTKYYTTIFLDKNIFFDTGYIRYLESTGINILTTLYNPFSIKLESNVNNEIIYSIKLKCLTYNKKMHKYLLHGFQRVTMNKYNIIYPNVNLSYSSTIISLYVVDTNCRYHNKETIISIDGKTHKFNLDDFVRYPYDKITCNIWSHKHAFALRESLSNILPEELICEIENNFIFENHYLIPLNVWFCYEFYYDIIPKKMVTKVFAASHIELSTSAGFVYINPVIPQGYKPHDEERLSTVPTSIKKKLYQQLHQ